MGVTKRGIYTNRPGTLSTTLKNQKEVSTRAILKIYRREAELIAKAARDMAPVDTDALVESIEVVEGRDPATGRKQVIVQISPTARDEDGNSVMPYARIMEDSLMPYGKKPIVTKGGRSRYNLGPKSRLKDQNSRSGVGGSFMYRAFRSRIGVIGKEVKIAAKRSIRSRIASLVSKTLGLFK